MRPVHSTLAAVAVVTIALLTAACDGNSPEARGPAPTVAPAATDKVETTPSTPTTSWQTAYTSDELSAYDEAISRFATYEQRSEPIWSAGKVTPAAEALFRDFFPSPAWQLVLDKLTTYEQVEVKVSGLPTIVWSKATRISVTPTGAAVAVRQCADYTVVQTTQYGSVVDREAVFNGPVLRTLRLQRSGTGEWLIYENREPTAKDAKPCDSEGAP